MILGLLFFLQINPPGVAVLPSQAALYSVSGGTAVVEVRDSLGLTVPFTDTGGGSYSNVTVSLPAGSAVGLGWEIAQTKPDGTHFLNPLSSSQYTVLMKMNCSATESPVGTFDSSAGAGSGIAAGYPGPGANTPTVLLSGVSYTIAPGSVITGSVAALSANPLQLAFFDVGGVGDTINLDCQDAAGNVLPFVDSNGVSWPSITVSLPAGGAGSAMWLALATAPDGTHLITTLPTGVARLNWFVVTGSSGVPTVAMNMGGLPSGAAGSGGNGCDTGFAPSGRQGTLVFLDDSGSVGR